MVKNVYSVILMSKYKLDKHLMKKFFLSFYLYFVKWSSCSNYNDILSNVCLIIMDDCTDIVN